MVYHLKTEPLNLYYRDIFNATPRDMAGDYREELEALLSVFTANEVTVQEKQGQTIIVFNYNLSITVTLKLPGNEQELIIIFNFFSSLLSQ